MAEIALAAVADTEKPLRGLRGDERAAVLIHLTAAELPAAILAPMARRRMRPPSRVPLNAPLAVSKGCVSRPSVYDDHSEHTESSQTRHAT